ncbi:hypothetical protein C0995_012714 [Termitomyces sp. Mi166|nr:hypothetical protein C0995_012714 [Termitomyces sp. Mi166\
MHLRVPLVLVSFVALLLPSVAANRLFRSGSGASPRSSDAQHDVIVGRQFRVKRDAGDRCVSISGIDFARRVNLGPDSAFEKLTVTTCKRDIETWLANDPNGRALVKIVGLDAAKTSLDILSPTVERRQAPSAIAKRQVPSGMPAAVRRRRSLPILTLAQAKQTCKINESVCGVAGREDDARAFECINTQSSLDNCGGCVIPHPFYDPYAMTSKGIECGRLPHVKSAHCEQSQCIVSQCKDGYEPTHDKTDCVPVIFESPDEHVLVDGASPQPVKRQENRFHGSSRDKERDIDKRAIRPKKLLSLWCGATSSEGLMQSGGMDITDPQIIALGSCLSVLGKSAARNRRDLKLAKIETPKRVGYIDLVASKCTLWLPLHSPPPSRAMRIGPTLLVSALVAWFFPFITLAHDVHHSRSGSLTAKRATHKNFTPEVIAQRQYHVRRDLIDLCLNVDASAVAPILQLINPLAANIRLCLCVKDLDIFLNSDIGVLLGGLLGSPDGLLTKLKLLCNFPTHSHRLCVAGNPCAYECDPPYVKEGDKCICKQPLTECNGVCAYHPHGCSSAAPRKQLRETSSITSYAAAVAICKPGQTVCGIPGREGTKDFECIDTRTTLDSCGGCIVQHPFSDGPAAAKGVDCGRLPGVITSNCSDYRCEITQCRSGWHLEAKRNECVKVPAYTGRYSIGSRMKKASKRNRLEVETVIASELASQLNEYGLLVLNLSDTSRATSTALTSLQPASGSSTPSIDQAYYVNTAVAAALYTLRSPTVVALVANINSLVNVNALALNAFEGCRCIDTLGLHSVYDDLIAVVNAGLSIQNWCHNHPVGVPSNSTNTITVPNTSDAPITIGLDDVLNALGIASRNSHIDVFGLGPSLTGTTNSLLNGLGLGPANVRPRSLAPLSTTALNPDLLNMTKALVDAVVILKNCDPNLPPPQPSSPAQPPNLLPGKPPVDYNLINTILQATYNLLNSHTVSTFVGNIHTLVDVNSIVADTLRSCGCVDGLGLGGLLENLTTVIDAALGIQDWCTHNPVGVLSPPSTSLLIHDPTSTPTLSIPSGPSATSPPSPPNSQDTTVIVDLDLNALLSSIGLGSTSGGNLLGLNDLLGGILAPITSTSPGSAATGIINTGNLVDSTLLSQIQALVNLTLAIQNGSAALPPAPPNSTGDPLPGSVPVDGNLVTGIVQATLNLLNSGTVGELLYNLQVLVNVNALAQSSLAGCGCVDQLGLTELVKNVGALLAAVLNLQSWCAGHPVVVPSNPHTSSLPTSTTVSGHTPSLTPGLAPIPTPGPNSHLLDLVIDLGLGDLVSALTLGLTSNVNATADLDDLLNILVGVVVQIQNHSTSLPPASTTTSVLPAVAAPAIPDPLGSPLPLTQGVINNIVQAVAVLLNSTTTADLLTNVNALLNLSGLLGGSMDHCGCIDSWGLHALEDDLNALLDALLTLHTWCQYHPRGNDLDRPGSGSDTIKIDAQDLLAALGLDKALQVKGNVTGLGLSSLVNPLLHGLGLGGIRRWATG